MEHRFGEVVEAADCPTSSGVLYSSGIGTTAAPVSLGTRLDQTFLVDPHALPTARVSVICVMAPSVFLICFRCKVMTVIY